MALRLDFLPPPSRINYDCFYAGWDHVNIVGKPLISDFIKDVQAKLVRGD